MPRVILKRAALALTSLVVRVLVSSLTWMREGRVGKRPLPPFGVDLDAPQLAVLARLETGEVNPNTVIGWDRELGWCVRPLAEQPSGRIHINARGLRGLRDYDELPAPGKLRLACFGDSFTFGDEVEDELTYEAFLERIAPSVEALNFGVSAYGTDQALLRLQREGVGGARVAVLGLLLENIGRNVNRYRPLWTARTLSPLAKPRFVLESTGLKLIPQPYATGNEFALAVRLGEVQGDLSEHEYWRDRPAVWTGKYSSLGRLAAGWFAYRERDPKRLWLDKDGEPRRETMALVEAFRAKARAAGAKEVLVLILPMREELADYRASGQAYWNEALADFTSQGIECLDLAPALAAEDARCENDPAHPTLYVAAHFSSVGNQVIALEIEKWLVANHLLLPRAEAR